MSEVSARKLDEIAAPPGLPGPVQSFVKITRQLAGLLERETELLQTKRPKEAQALHGEKARLTAEYRKLLSILRINEGRLLGDVQSAARTYLKRVTEAFREVLAAHARLVMRLRYVCEGIVNAIGEEAAKQNQQTVTHYGRDARLHNGYGRSAPARSLSIDARI
ncbi:MAG: hypothetical protein ACFB22_10075 [Rhodothalassiaceae bacterium]